MFKRELWAEIGVITDAGHQVYFLPVRHALLEPDDIEAARAASALPEDWQKFVYPIDTAFFRFYFRFVYTVGNPPIVMPSTPMCHTGRFFILNREEYAPGSGQGILLAGGLSFPYDDTKDRVISHIQRDRYTAAERVTQATQAGIGLYIRDR